jgi:hypothetical protein
MSIEVNSIVINSLKLIAKSFSTYFQTGVEKQQQYKEPNTEIGNKMQFGSEL